MSNKVTTENFISKARNLHGDKYNYSQVNYCKAILKVKIICPTHGAFEQTPNSHLNGRGCKKCGYEHLHDIKYIGTEKFIQKAYKIHGKFYDYSKVNYINNSTHISIICPVHGEFLQVPPLHLISGCKLCNYTPNHNKKVQRNKEHFIEMANNKFGNKYDYSNIDYKNAKTEVIITCPIHGQFKQKPDIHLQGKGCKECNKGVINTFSKSRFCSNKEVAYLYLVNLVSEEENFLKIGITAQSVEKRFSNKRFPYKIISLYELPGSPNEVWETEQKIKKMFVNFKYAPVHNFSGKSECYSEESSKILIPLMSLLIENQHFTNTKPIPIA